MNEHPLFFRMPENYDAAEKMMANPWWQPEYEDLFEPDFTIDMPFAPPGMDQHLGVGQMLPHKEWLNRTVKNWYVKDMKAYGPRDTFSNKYIIVRRCGGDVHWGGRDGHFESRMTTLLSVKNGKICYMKEWFNPLEFLKAAGLDVSAFRQNLDREGNPRDRSVLGVVRDYGVNIGGFLVSTFGTMMIIRFSNAGGEMTSQGFTKVAVIAAVFALICYYVVFFTQKERIEPPKSTVGFFKGLKISFKNKAVVCLLLMGFCFNMAIQFKANMTSYFCINAMGNPASIGTLLTLVYTLPLIGLLFVPKLMQVFERRTFLSFAGLLTVLSGIISLIAGTNLPGQIVSSAFLGLALSCTFALIWGSMPDAIDDGEIRTGQRAPGVTYAMGTFMIKAAAGLSSFVAGWILTWIHYQPEAAAQTAETLSVMTTWYGVYPIIWGALMFIFSRIYNLDRKTVAANAEVLAAKRASEREETVRETED
ncbi:MAG: hypothetical protein HFG80_14905 [Eubacterium sp.]|nr:hypothetical protein [Eubacterium sp.]